MRPPHTQDNQKIADDAIALIEKKRPELLTVHFVSADHQQHEHGPFSAEGNAALERIDAQIGRIVAAHRKAFPGSVIAIVSDHGFDAVKYQVNLNAVLAEAGFIKLVDTLSADVLWLAIRVKHMLGDRATEASLAAQLRKRFPGSPEYAAFERGAFSE